VTVGETLTEARTQAGLSVDELSERTRIRGTVIRSIEQDDFEACGGDLYVRGYVRAIAGAVGIDAQPLIREYYQGKAGQNERANGSTGRHAPALPSAAPPAAPTTFDLPAVSETPATDGPAALDATRSDLPVVSADPAKTAYDMPAVPETPPTAELPVVPPPVSPTAEFPTVPPVATPPVAEPPATAELSAVPLPAVQPNIVQPPGAAETRFDMAAVPEDLMAAGYDVRPAEPVETDSATAILPALGGEPAALGDNIGQPATVQLNTVPPTTGQPDWMQPDPVPPGRVPPNIMPPNTVPPNNGQPVPGQLGDLPPGRERGSRRGLFAVAAIIVVIAIGVLGVHLATGSTTTKNAAATTVPTSAAASSASASAAQASASAQAKASASAQASESAQARRQAAAKAAAQHVTTLSVASVAAYGPTGLGDGDNPGNASDAIARHASTPWTSQWYVTPEFGMLKHGTGLLLNLGGKVTVSSVRLELPQFQGTDLQIRVGNGTSLQDLRVAAKATNVTGLVKLTLRQPTAARYLLIWITQLPPDGAGHYQASVSNVVVTGRR
jgi:cytoskeletal protein RodZ